MGCGSSSNSDPYNRSGYDNRYPYNSGYDGQGYPGQYNEMWKDGNNYYDDNIHSNYPQSPKSNKKPQNHNNEEDDSTFDDDGVADNQKYSRDSTGCMRKTLDFRTKFLDEESEKRPRISPGKLFVDEDFSLKTAIVKDNKGVEWKRPKEFVKNPKFFTEGTTYFDVGQGTAGTCWFLSVLASIADNKEIMKEVIPPDAYMIEDPDKYDGVVHARFFKFGKWEDVYTDDYLPVVNGNELWGAKSASDEDEMWVALLEKAFARMHGSYDAIYGGQPGDAYLFLTGGVGERIDLADYKEEEKARALYDRLKNALGSGCQVSCLVLDECDNYKGLVGGHAYSVIDLFQDKTGKVRLIKMRNPWGNGEWKGPWSDGSSEWSTIQKNSVMPPKKDDGEFYISLADFMKNFSQTTICSPTPDFDCDGIADRLNFVLYIYGEWQGKSAGGFHDLLHNQRFCFTVTEAGLVDNSYIPLVIQIIQQSKNRKTDKVSIRCDVFKVHGDKIRPKNRHITLEIQGTKTNLYTPELQTIFRHKLKPGRYMLIASTADKGQEKAFLLRVFSPAPLENVKNIPMDTNLSYCENESNINIRGRIHEFNFEKALFGAFIAQKNAGGQASNRSSYHLNPQYLLTVPDTGSEVPVAIHVVQAHTETVLPIGVRMFQLDNSTEAPVGIKYLYDHYDNCPSHMEDSQSKFQISSDVDVRYLLKPGRYLLLIHLDKPDTEKSYSIIFKSPQHIAIKGFQTG